MLKNLISNITPLDDLEKTHLTDTLSWINSGAPLYRIQKPDVPDKHLVSYFVLYDKEASKLLLVDHKKAGLWLPAGGHVEPDEHPQETVRRECLEELEIESEFLHNHPVFLTVTPTVGITAGHTDVSLWYVLKGDHKQTYQFDRNEFNSIKWFGLDDIPYERSDPHMKRFMRKIRQA